MSKKVIDVSSYQGVINWAKVKASGVQGAILKVIRKDLNPDKQFENNWKGCEKAGVPIVGVYNYSYATTVDKARVDAKKVLSILAGRKVKVWLDVEDTCQKGLGMKLIRIIRAYQEVIEAAGLEFGVYTGLSFYNSYIKPWSGYLTCRFWIARYRNPVVANQPLIKHTLEGWQFSSKERVTGISGNVDMNLWYGDIMSMPEVRQENPYDPPDRLLKLKPIRMRGNDVGWVQYHLIRLGFLSAKNSKGKRNAAGSHKGAPTGNKNAEKDGAYSAVFLATLSEEEKMLVEATPLEVREALEHEMKVLKFREHKILSKIAEYEAEDEGAVFLSTTTEIRGKNNTTMRFSDSAFKRVQSLQEALYKVQGRIAKVTDSLRAVEEHAARMELERQRLDILRMRASGTVDAPEVEPDDMTDVEREDEK